jgi:hypothetical protein
MTAFLQTDKLKKGLEKFYLSSVTTKSISNFRETIPVNKEISVLKMST